LHTQKHHTSGSDNALHQQQAGTEYCILGKAATTSLHRWGARGARPPHIPYSRSPRETRAPAWERGMAHERRRPVEPGPDAAPGWGPRIDAPCGDPQKRKPGRACFCSKAVGAARLWWAPRCGTSAGTCAPRTHQKRAATNVYSRAVTAWLQQLVVGAPASQYQSGAKTRGAPRTPGRCQRSPMAQAVRAAARPRLPVVLCLQSTTYTKPRNKQGGAWPAVPNPRLGPSSLAPAQAPPALQRAWPPWRGRAAARAPPAWRA
jgi:hypothetical protein